MSPIIAAAVIVFCEGLVLWSVFPVMNFYCEELGASPERTGMYVGLLFMLQGGPKVFLNPVFGRLSDRFGRRPLVALSSLGTMMGSVAWALAPNVGWLAASRAITGIFGAQAALSAAVVADHTDARRRGAGMGLVGAAFGVSMILGPLIGGEVTRLGGHAAVGWAGAVIQGIAVIVALSFIPARSANSQAHTATDRTAPQNKLLREPNVGILLAVTFLMTLALAQVTASFGLLADRRYAFTEAQTGYAFAFFGLIGTIVQGGVVRTLSPRVGDRPLALVGLALTVTCTLWIATAPAAWGVITAMAVLGAGVSLCMPTVTALVSHCVDHTRQGALLGYHQSATALGRALGAGLAGVAISGIGLGAPYVTAASVAALAGMLLATVRVRHHEADDSSVTLPPD